jgi:hypothetical protein
MPSVRPLQYAYFVNANISNPTDPRRSRKVSATFPGIKLGDRLGQGLGHNIFSATISIGPDTFGSACFSPADKMACEKRYEGTPVNAEEIAAYRT